MWPTVVGKRTFITLPSHVKNDLGGQNFISSYVTKLPVTLDTRGETYVGLREITLTNSLNNSPDTFSTKYWLIANLQLSADLEIPEFFTDETGAPFFRIAKQAVPLLERSIPIGHYDTPLDLAVSLQYSMTKEQRKLIAINYHPAIKRISIKLQANCYLVVPKRHTQLGAL